MIDSGYFWTIVFFLAIGTLAIRGSIIAMSSRIRISDQVRNIFSYIPAAILPAFIAPSVFFHQGQVGWAYGKERLVVLLLSAGVCLYTRSTFLTITFGLIALYCISQIF